MRIFSLRVATPLLAGIIFFEAAYLMHGGIIAPPSLQEYTNSVIAKCSSDSYAPACYDKEIPKLMDFISMEQAFDVVRLVQKKDPRYLNCHVVGHFLAGRETAKAPEKWKDVIARCPMTICNNGCLHGPLLERYKSESLTPEQIAQAKEDIRDACEPRGKWHPTEVERTMCYHALGHLHMYMTNADLKRSVELCEDVGKKSDGRNYVQTCTEGVFMQVFQGLDPEDFSLVAKIKPAKEGVQAFCAPFKGSTFAFDACHREAWPLFLQEILTPEGLVEFCTYTNDGVAQRQCYGSLMNVITADLYIDGGGIEPLKNFCSALPKQIEGVCFGEAARRLMQIDPVYAHEAKAICDVATTYDTGDACFEILARFASTSFPPGSPQLSQFCQLLPEKWQKICAQKNW